ncbi:Pleckstrin [Trichinella spiralis]|uniref:Pleckstrin n=1 Tax=Trichinella spiralis TaxID=6334 RepID=A0ABR3K6V4_TRISP
MRRRGWRTYRLLMALCVKLQIQEQEPSEPSPKPALTNPSQAASIKTTVNILLTHTRGTTQMTVDCLFGSAASQIIIRDYMADALCLIRQVETVIPYRYHPAQVRRVFSPLRLFVSGAGEGDENIIQVLTSS